MNINARDENGRTALMQAVLVSDKDLVMRLLAEGANPNSKDGEQETVLFYAIRKGDLRLVRSLVGAGADFIQVRNVNGDSPLSLAVRGAYTKIAEFLISRGAEVDEIMNQTNGNSANASLAILMAASQKFY